MKLVEYESREVWAECLAAELARQLADALKSAGRATLIAAGGSTPLPVYRAMSLTDIDWSEVTVVPSDERCVSERSLRSNLGMIRLNLLQENAALARVFPLFNERQDGDNSELICKALEPLLPAAACLLGMGEDLHTASLFPKAAELQKAMSDSAPPMLPVIAPITGERRMTLSLRTLASSKFIEIAIRGRAKYESFGARFGRHGPA